MKIPLAFLVFALVLIAIPEIALADTAPVSTPTAPSDAGAAGGSPDQRAQRMERMKAAFAQLDLTDAQKAQIQQIRQTVTDRKERREAIKNVLTPEQQAKLKQLREEHKAQTGSAPTGTGGNQGT